MHVRMGSGREHRGRYAAWQLGCGLDFSPSAGASARDLYLWPSSACWPTYLVPNSIVVPQRTVLPGGGSQQNLKRLGGGLPGRYTRPGDEGEVVHGRKPYRAAGWLLCSHILQYTWGN